MRRPLHVGELVMPVMAQLKRRMQDMDVEKAMEMAGEAGTSGKPRLPEENEARVVGRVVNSPKTKEGAGANGNYQMARFTLAVNRSYKEATGKWVRETDFVPVVAWGALAEAVGKTGKGTALRVEGRIKTWEAEGKKYRWELKANTLEILELRRSPQAEPAQEQGELLAS